MNDSVEVMNQAALEALSLNEIYQVQTLFRENVRKNPCLMTFNNLGVFHIVEGLIKPDNRIRKARELGIAYLKKAESFEVSGLNLTAIASVYLKTKEFDKAIHYYCRASEMFNSYALFNNYAVSLYFASLFEKASVYFFKALDCCPNSDEKQEIIISYAYAMLKIDKKRCYRIVTEMTNSDIISSQMLDVDKFVLLYLCDDFESSSTSCKSMFCRYSIDKYVFAMILDCLFKMGKDDEAKECLNLQIESLHGYDYDIRKEEESANIAFISCDYRNNLISEYRYIPTIIEQCYYYGCKQHNPHGS